MVAAVSIPTSTKHIRRAAERVTPDSPPLTGLCAWSPAWDPSACEARRYGVAQSLDLHLQVCVGNQRGTQRRTDVSAAERDGLVHLRLEQGEGFGPHKMIQCIHVSTPHWQL